MNGGTKPRKESHTEAICVCVCVCVCANRIEPSDRATLDGFSPGLLPSTVCELHSSVVMLLSRGIARSLARSLSISVRSREVFCLSEFRGTTLHLFSLGLLFPFVSESRPCRKRIRSSDGSRFPQCQRCQTTKPLGMLETLPLTLGDFDVNLGGIFFSVPSNSDPVTLNTPVFKFKNSNWLASDSEYFLRKYRVS